MERPVLRAALATLLALGAVACHTAGAPAPQSAGDMRGKYPRRGSGCDIAVYHTAVPGAQAWDDLGIAEVGCHVSLPMGQCLAMLKAEGCRLGGDMLYNVPRSPLRPSDQVMVLRGQVAHTRSGKAARGETEDELPPPASAAEQAQPIVPLTGAVDPAAAAQVPTLPHAPDPTAGTPSP
jgi:hypothetical protein